MLSLRVVFLMAGALGISLFAGCGAIFINSGSKASSYADHVPDAQWMHQSSIPSENREISNFSDGTVYMNPYLYGSGLGYWKAVGGDAGEPDSNFIVEGSLDGSKAAHIVGFLTDTGNASYPTLALEGKFKEKGYYDLTSFRGVRFYYKSNDQASIRRFEFGIASTVPVEDGGVCTEQCGNHFGAYLQPTTDWTQESFNFKDLTREQGWGATLDSDDFMDYLKEVVYIKWENGTNNVPGMYRIDYWVDKVEFY